MEELKLISTETLRDLIYEKFERMPDYPKTAEEEDPLAKVCLIWFISGDIVSGFLCKTKPMFEDLDLLSEARIHNLLPRESLK